MKIKEYKNGAYVSQDLPSGPQGLTVVKVYTPAGYLHDKILCDSPRIAGEYFRAFCAIAKNL